MALSNNISFRDFIIKNKNQKIILFLSLCIITIQFSIFKYFYPFPNFIHGDSFYYIEAAYNNNNISTYPIGYSKFLRIFSVFTKSDTALVAFQYLSIQTSSFFFLFTLFYLYNIAPVLKISMICVILFNPLFYHLANLISSDCIFASVSLFWFSSLLWIIYKPNKTIITIHGILLFIAFTIRYNALIYPIISILSFYLSHISVRSKIIGLGFSFILCGLFISYTSYKYKQLTGQWQFSPFSGWQLANNSAYAFQYVNYTSYKTPSIRFQKPDSLLRAYIQYQNKTFTDWKSTDIAGTWYMWSQESPLYAYSSMRIKPDQTPSEFKKWASMGPYYKDYGLYLIKQYPKEFLKYFIWPNANKYFAPPVEYLSLYNSASDKVSITTQKWFDFRSGKISNRFNKIKIKALDFYPILSGLINVAMLFGFVFFIITKGLNKSNPLRKGIILVVFTWLLNASFTIMASSAALRFQVFPILLSLIFSLIFFNWLFKITESEKKADNSFSVTNFMSLEQPSHLNTSTERLNVHQ